jgi:hypothetical protein
MDELVFLGAEDPEGGYIARAVGQAIFTEADNLVALDEMVRDAILCHFEDGKAPERYRIEFIDYGEYEQ